jgi:hypothetical protein
LPLAWPTQAKTSSFIAPSSTGSNELLILGDYNSNYIHAKPMKNITATKNLATYKCAHSLFVQAGLGPILQRLNNKCSSILKDFLRAKDVNFQIVPSHIHHHNPAKRAIPTFNNHFIAGLCSTDKKSPLHLWDHLLSQALISLNLLHQFCLNPKLSANAQLNGFFDYNSTPMGPSRTPVLTHKKPSNRTSWSTHSSDG